MIIDRTQWHLTHEPRISELFDMVMGFGDVWLAGGAARSLLTKEPVRDFDLFFRSEAAKDRTVNLLEFQGFEVIFKCPEGKLTTLYRKGFPKVQCVTMKYYHSRPAVIQDFDFTVCMFVADYEVIETTEQAFIDAFMKSLRVWKITFPTASMTRMTKYIQYGYQPVKGFSTEFLEDTVKADVENMWKAYID